MFGKIMQLPDTLMESYYTLLTDLPPEEFSPLIQANPRDAKVGWPRRSSPGCTMPLPPSRRGGVHQDDAWRRAG